jgi:hypothetical protein
MNRDFLNPSSLRGLLAHEIAGAAARSLRKGRLVIDSIGDQFPGADAGMNLAGVLRRPGEVRKHAGN